MTFPRKPIIIFLLGAVLAANARTTTIRVGAGETISSLPAAIDAAREARRHGAANVEILLHTGNYPLEKPLILTAEDSGLVIAAMRHQTPVITGGAQIHGWTPSPRNPNIWQTQLPEVRSGNWVFHELFVNGRRKPRTRIPETGYFHAVGAALPEYPTELRFHSGDISPAWANSDDTELILYSAWAQTRNQIREVFENSNIVSLAGEAFPNKSEQNPRFFIENADVPLSPGQWHLNLRSGLLAYWPDAGESMADAIVTAPRLYDLVQLLGDASHPIHDVIFREISFADAGWPLAGGSDVDPQAAIERQAAVRAEFARHCAFERCAFQRLGQYALELGRGCQEDRIAGNDMRDLGAGGVRIGEADSYGGDHFPCGHHLVSDNHIHDIGLVNATGVGILVLLSASNDIVHNEIDHTFYTAISVGWTWGYTPTPCCGNIIEFNHLHDIGQGMLSDMGGVYTLGLQPGTVVRNNLIHDINDFAYGGWGLYTDEGSTGIVLESNIVFHCKSAGFHQHYGAMNVLQNNIFALNHDAQLAHTRIEHHVSFVFTNNIVYYNSGSLFAGNWGDDVVMDHNIYFDSRDDASQAKVSALLRKWRARGHDVHSSLLDPLFADPQKGNFRLRANSPALRLGFAPLNLNSAGPRRRFLRR